MTTDRTRPLVIGLVGGIASGKSAVADAFERRGCVVSRSDREAHALLERAEVRAQLVAWFGEQVLDSEGRIDRRAVGAIVFNDGAARKRLEGLIHPLLHAQRRALIAQAAVDGAPAVIVDAPLLFEAGVDAECDAVIFVDCAREIRLQRVMSGRGWDEAELDRRENAQLGLDVKRARADYVVENEGGLDRLDCRVGSLLRELLSGTNPDDRL